MSDEGSVVELEVGNVFADRIGDEHGLSRDDVADLKRRIKLCNKDIEKRRGEDIGFMELPYDDELAARVNEKAEELRGWCKNFVVLGIGGSALGNIATHGALNHCFHNLLPPDHPARKGAPRIFVLDNVDPALLTDFFDVIGDELGETAFNVITKSGSTAETMSEFLHVRDRLRRAGGDPARQIIATTDPRPEKSLLRRVAQEDGYATLPIPDNVGGRFSVLSAVGLLSAAVGGIDIDELLSGAAAMDERCRAATTDENPAALYAAVLYLFYKRGKPITVLMPYSARLARLGDWYCQLWAESLGKRDGLEAEDVFIGPTPVASVGVTDQHSVMQLYQDGKFDKVLTLIEVAEQVPEERRLPICEGESEPELSYLAKHTFGELFGAELTATRCALTDKHRPNMTLRVPRLGPRPLGELFMFFEYAVSYSGCLYGVNTFDQPGVELGKQYTYGLMGRQGYEPPTGA
ncbi:MAG: glucose-6-phosphate isomerase [Candidatus Brocadiia bacterium]